jgi:putative DNA primase/helicase
LTAAELATRWSAKRNGHGWIARCPAHDDQTASASFTDGDKGVVIRCHAGCATEDIVAKLGLTMADLFRADPPGPAKPCRRIVATYVYEDETDNPLYQTVRYEPKDFRQRRPDGNGGWIWNMTGVRRVLYRLPDLRARLADPNPEYRRRYRLPDDVFIVEGEKDADHLLMRGLIASTNIGGAGKWSEDYTEQLTAAGAKSIVVIADNDNPGRRHAQDVARSCYAAGLTVKVLDLPDVSDKGDVSDFLQTGINRLEALVSLASEGPEYSARTPPVVASAASVQAEDVLAVNVATTGRHRSGLLHTSGCSAISCD